jgi:two-component system nitrogen regulation sensor histidine kinase NtrY
VSIDIGIPDDILINGDLNQIKRAFVNLMQNALQDIGDKEGGNIKIQAHLGKTGYKGEVFISVRDNGEGIRDEDIGRIFVPYFSKKPGGTGLGLAIVKKIIEEHGGHIAVESKFGEFTEFRISLPA